MLLPKMTEATLLFIRPKKQKKNMICTVRNYVYIEILSKIFSSCNNYVKIFKDKEGADVDYIYIFKRRHFTIENHIL